MEPNRVQSLSREAPFTSQKSLITQLVISLVLIIFTLFPICPRSGIVVAGGYGVGSKEGFDQLFELAHLLHGEVGASRAAVDAGWVDHDRQIGQTGVTVHPKVYIACGISGQIQHIAGMQDSGIIISVNNDPDAPINKIADYVINGNVEDVVPKLIKYYKQNSK